MKINRTLFWFSKSKTQLNELTARFYGLAFLLNRLMNEVYDGKKIKFINLEFNDEATYEAYPHIPKNEPYNYSGHLKFFGLLDYNLFFEMDDTSKNKFLWEKAHDYLLKLSKSSKNKKLELAVNYAFTKGIENNLNTDYKVLEETFLFSSHEIECSVWIYFKNNGMHSKLLVKNKLELIYEQEIDRTDNGVEFFLEIYKELRIEGNKIILSGSNDIDYLPLEIILNPIVQK